MNSLVEVIQERVEANDGPGEGGGEEDEGVEGGAVEGGEGEEGLSYHTALQEPGMEICVNGNTDICP